MERNKEKTMDINAVADNKNSKNGSFLGVFMHADTIDMWLMTFGFIGAVGDGLGTPVMLLFTSKIFNHLGHGLPSQSSTDQFSKTINENSVDLLYLAIGLFAMAFLEGYCWSRTGERQASRMRARYLKAVLRQDVEYFDLKVASSAEVIDSVSSDSLVIQDVISEKVPNFIMNASTFLSAYAVGFILLWRLVIVAFPTVILLVIPGIMYGRRLMDLTRKIREEYGKAGAVAEQTISSIRTVYSFAAETRTMAKFSAALGDSVKLGLRQGFAKGLAIGSNGITFSIWAFMTWYGSRLVMYHGSQGGTVYAVAAVIIFGGLALGSGLPNLKYFSEANSAAARVMEMINRVPKIDTESDEGEELKEVSGNVEFRHVKFAYPSRPETMVFRDFNLKVPAGRTVALVGSSGSGKSTTIALLERFYDPLSGEVLLDGVDIRKLKLKWLRSQMGLVSQEPALFATSIKENILFGKEDATIDDIVTAAKAANAHNFISELPQGYDTQVGERGVQMSGGQKQRIAIARAIIKSPKILLLDEATSALDTESERVVQAALDLAAVGRTTIVIAHRLSTIQNADLIAIVQSGHVVDLGAHDDLIQNPNGIYPALVRLQQTSGLTKFTSLPTKTTMTANSLRKSSSSMSRRNTSSFEAHEWQDPEQTKAAMRPVPSFRRLLSMNKPEWKHAVLGGMSSTIFGAIQPVYAYARGSMISLFFLADHREIKDQTRTYALIFVALSVFSLVINILQHYNLGAMGEHLTKRVRERMLSKILTFEVGWFDRDENSTGAVCSQLTKDANVVRSLVGDRLSLIIQTVSAVTVACTMGLVIAWRLALVMIAVQPLIIVCFYARRVLLKRISSKAIKSQADSSKLAAEAVNNLRTITAFSSQERVLLMFEGAQDGPRRESIRQSWYAGIGLASSQSLVTCTWALDFWYGGKLITQGYISAKALFQTFMILVSTGHVIADAGSMTTDLAKGADAVGSVFAVLDRQTEIEPDDPKGHKPDKLLGFVEFQGIEFAYPARADVVVLRNFSLTVEAGKSTALVGQSGSGKSTIIALIERFYDPLKGTVKIDGKDVNSYNLRALRRHIGLVSQEPTLFAGTIMENITYGTEGATEGEIDEAVRTANAHEFISCLKDGYRTCCGDGGVQLSGGQKQRIAIARAILKNPAILLLDEATSALDSQSEKVVQEALERVMVGRTSVVVAHRLSTIQNCDLIAVLEKGVVLEKGNHGSLMAKGPSGAYYGLVSLQQGNTGH